MSTSCGTGFRRHAASPSLHDGDLSDAVDLRGKFTALRAERLFEAHQAADSDDFTTSRDFSTGRGKRQQTMLKGKEVASVQASPENLIIGNDSDREFLLRIFNHSNAVQKLCTLEVHLDAELNAHQEDVLAAALNMLHPRPDGTNPHSLKAIKIVVHRKTLSTRYTYQFIPSALSVFATSESPRFISDSLSSADKANLEVKVKSTEKRVANVLPGIRDVPQIYVTGKGLRGDYRPVTSSCSWNCNHRDVFRVDKRSACELPSSKYGANLHLTYAANIKPKLGGSHDRVLVDETSMLLGHLIDANEDDEAQSSGCGVNWQSSRRARLG